MKLYKIVFVLLFIAFSISPMFSMPPDPGGGAVMPGYGVEVPLDGGILLALLAGGSVLGVFLKKKKENNKQ